MTWTYHSLTVNHIESARSNQFWTDKYHKCQLCRAYSLTPLISLMSFRTYRVSCSCPTASLNVCSWQIREKKRNGWETSLRDASRYILPSMRSFIIILMRGSRWKHNQKDLKSLAESGVVANMATERYCTVLFGYYSPSSETFPPRINDNYYDLLSLSSN